MGLRGAFFVGDRSSGRDNHFNLIRMAAATGVLVSHAYPITQGPDASQPLEAWLHGKTLGSVCVYVFFAISGFFITKSYDRNPSVNRFLRARVLRLYPALAVVLILTVFVAGLAVTTASSHLFWAAVPEYLWRNLALYALKYDLPGVFVSNPFGPAINGSLWTLIHEVVCYIGVLLAGVIGLLRSKLMLAIVMALFVLLVFVDSVFSIPLPYKLHAFLNLAFPFAIGCAFYVWRHRVLMCWPLALVLSVLGLLAWWTPLFQMVFAGVLSYWVFFIGLAKAPAMLSYNKLGDYSYGTYIYAFPIQQLIVWAGVGTVLGNILLAFSFTLVCAILSWHLVEKPMLKLVGRSKRTSLMRETGT